MGIPEIYKQHCKSKRNIDCPYLLHRDCPNSCAYAKEIAGMFVGSKLGPVKGLEDKVFNQKE